MRLPAGPSVPYGCKPLLLHCVTLWVTTQSSTCTLCVCSNSFCCLHCIPHPQQPPPRSPLYFSLLCHVFIILVFSSPPDTYPTAPAYLLLLPHHTCHFSPFSPLSEAAGQRDALSLTCYAAEYQGKSAAATQSETRKGKTSATAEKGNYILSFFPS